MNKQAIPLFKALTIAGSDSIGGAGIQADMKTIAALGGYAATAITALTAQNTLGVHAVYEIPASFVARQIDAVVSDTGADIVKTGMLYSKDIIETVAPGSTLCAFTCCRRSRHAVKKWSGTIGRRCHSGLDLSIVSLGFHRYAKYSGSRTYFGHKNSKYHRCRKGCKIHTQTRPANVLIKGGHALHSSDIKSSNTVIDILYTGKSFAYIEGEYLPAKHVHGTGCVYASAIAAYLAKGCGIAEAVRQAKKFVVLCIKKSFSPGRGYDVMEPFSTLAPYQ
ncbi:bifunctional hydroxymethylpyrimidine kinase/phosphomethylpyrimidine kinase [Candidatus Kuenenia stuttgartiensis]|uniref:bifunctional hydroxymethylpyrimidine kinase/phosphomethylpyrimidine kinase n=1 Tax=Kuenenia stuttgartiensis TaxID=174633 RepID=UPI001B8AF91F|nr:hydroxymethylpyrimidine/phosphomethylpyrimidine kinase [Candidatus Kuenenia stuttgartiensis]